MKASGSLGKRACDGLSPLPVEEKAIMESDKHSLFMDLARLAMAFSPCLSRRGRERSLMEDVSESSLGLLQNCTNARFYCHITAHILE